MEVGVDQRMFVIRSHYQGVTMLGFYFFSDSLTYILVKILVLGLVVGLWLMASSTPVT